MSQRAVFEELRTIWKCEPCQRYQQAKSKILPSLIYPSNESDFAIYKPEVCPHCGHSEFKLVKAVITSSLFLIHPDGTIQKTWR